MAWERKQPESVAGIGDMRHQAVDHLVDAGDKGLAPQANVGVLKDPETFMLVGCNDRNSVHVGATSASCPHITGERVSRQRNVRNEKGGGVNWRPHRSPPAPSAIDAGSAFAAAPQRNTTPNLMRTIVRSVGDGWKGPVRHPAQTARTAAQDRNGHRFRRRRKRA
jgi:hypothetical protein